MSWGRHHHLHHGQRDRYHHGNLREALLEAATSLIAAHGPNGFSFAQVARQAGVSPAAPYRHFRDRAALVAEVARRGFEQFENELKRAWNDGNPDPMQAFSACGRAYLGFARAHPAVYAAMFESSLPLADEPELRQAGDRAFDVLLHAAERLVADLPAEWRPPARMVALHVWAVSHGIASLFVVGGEGGATRRIPGTPEEMLEAAMLVYLRGLAAGPEKSG
jgi:AcrR family transcriptional regulator